VRSYQFLDNTGAVRSGEKHHIVIALSVCLVQCGCENSGNQLVACKYEADKVLVQSPPCPPDKLSVSASDFDMTPAISP